MEAVVTNPDIWVVKLDDTRLYPKHTIDKLYSIVGMPVKLFSVYLYDTDVVEDAEYPLTCIDIQISDYISVVDPKLFNKLIVELKSDVYNQVVYYRKYAIANLPVCNDMSGETSSHRYFLGDKWSSIEEAVEYAADNKV